MSKPKKTVAVIATAATLSAALAGGAWWHTSHRPATTSLPRVYVGQGYGGYTVPAQPSQTIHPAATTPAHASPVVDPVRPLQEAYNAGRYLQAEAAAQAVIQTAARSRSVKQHTQAAFARQILAYSAARRHDLPLARVRFAAMQTEAARLPDKGLEAAPLGQVAPTLEAEAAFQHAVCTNALGDKTGAEAEYIAFMQRYPESMLVHAAVLRLQQMHGGDLSPAEEAVRQAADRTGRRRQEARMREGAMCGPECLAELLRRRGKAADIRGLADEMRTSDRGTSLAALAAAAARRGFTPRGLALTPKGLSEQRLPVIALTMPAHYVLVEQASLQQVTIWDPDARGFGHGGRRRVSPADWERLWQGTTLALEPASVWTAQR